MSSKEKKIRLLRLLYIEGCIDREEYDYMAAKIKDDDEGVLPPPPVVH